MDKSFCGLDGQTVLSELTICRDHTNMSNHIKWVSKFFTVGFTDTTMLMDFLSCVWEK